MQSLDNQFEYWDKASLEKSFTHTLDFEKFQPYVSHKSRILDYGCGYGRICNELQIYGYEDVLGIDSSEKMIERGRKTYPNANLLPLREGCIHSESFDAIILMAVLTCIPSDEGQKELVGKLLENLKIGGIIYISDYWLQNDERNLIRYEKFEKKYKQYGVFELPDGAIVRHHTEQWMSSLLQNFETIDSSNCIQLSMNGSPSSCFHYIGRRN